MIRSLAIAARFLLFHVLSVFMTAIMLVVLSPLMTAIIDGKVDWVNLGQDLIVALVMAAAVAALLLIPSALGWWGGGVLLKRSDAPLNRRLAGQGAMAGLAGFASFISMLIWLENLSRQSRGSAQGQLVLEGLVLEGLMELSPLLLGIPTGAFFGWLVYRHMWPNLPAAPQLR